MKRVFLYGLGSAKKAYKVMDFMFIPEEQISVFNMIHNAQLMLTRNGNVETVYAIDDRRGLRKDFEDSLRGHSIESYAVFKDILERDGIKLI